MMVRHMIRASLLCSIFLFLMATEGSSQNVPRLRATKGAWSKQQVTQWATNVRSWASQTKGVVLSWAHAEKVDPGPYTKDLDALIRHSTVLKDDPYNLYETCVTRELLSEVKGVFAIMASADGSGRNRQFTTRMNEAMMKARDFNDAMLDHGDALTKWYAANSPRPSW